MEGQKIRMEQLQSQVKQAAAWQQALYGLEVFT